MMSDEVDGKWIFSNSSVSEVKGQGSHIITRKIMLFLSSVKKNMQI